MRRFSRRGTSLESSGELAQLLERLADEIEVLRESVDELRDELTYELRKLRDEVSEPALAV